MHNEAEENIVTHVSDPITAPEDQVSTSNEALLDDTNVLETTTTVAATEPDKAVPESNEVLRDTIQELIHETISSVIENLDTTADEFAASEMTWSDLAASEQQPVSRAGDDLSDEHTDHTLASSLSDQSQSLPVPEDRTEQTVMPSGVKINTRYSTLKTYNRSSCLFRRMI